MINQKSSIQKLTYAGVFAAVIAVSAQIAIPMPGGVPLTLQTLAIMFAGIILGAKNGTLAVVIYVLIGLSGVPVFSGFTGGPGVVFGRTGGFILTFPILAAFAGIGAYKNRLWLGLWLILGVAVNFLSGTLMFGLVTGNSFPASFFMAALPFIPTELVKIGIAVAFGRSVSLLLRPAVSPDL